MAEGKWIADLTPETPVAEAARTALAVRLGAVRDRLGPAAEQANEDIEHVHQLRVATRRAGAALRIFRDFIPGKRLREAKAILRSVRRAAGEARDWDVFLEMLFASEVLTPANARPAADFFAGYAFGERAAAQVVLSGVAAAQAEAVRILAEYLPGTVRVPEDEPMPETLGGLATAVLGELFAKFAAGVEADPRTPEDLHQLRIAGKRVRYAMEVFAGCFGPPFREALYPAVEHLQTVLGAVQDGAVAEERLKDVFGRVRAVRPALAARIKPGVTALTREVRQQVGVEKRAFRTWTREWVRLTAAHPLPELLAVGVG